MPLKRLLNNIDIYSFSEIFRSVIIRHFNIITRVVFLLVSLSVLHGCQSASPKKGYYSNESHHAVVPKSKTSKWWQGRHQAILDRVGQGNVDLIFIGDSITHAWEEDGLEIWKQYYQPLNAVNLGYGGDRTENVLWRLQNGEVGGIAPRVAVVMIGTNNTYDFNEEEFEAFLPELKRELKQAVQDGEMTQQEADDIFKEETTIEPSSSPQQTADGVIAICETLQSKLPSTQILLLGIFPKAEESIEADEENEESEFYTVPLTKINDRIKKTNELLAGYADGQTVHYMDIGKQFLEKDGTLSTEVMPDLIHLSEKGYQIWAEAIDEKLSDLFLEANRIN